MATRPLVFSSGPGLLRCLRRGVGVALLPLRVVREDLAAGGLARLHWPPAPAETMLHMITHAEKWRSPLLERFLSMAREAILRG